MKTLTLAILLSLTGCAQTPKEAEVRYFIDQRTETCFATWNEASIYPWVGVEGVGIACVPCTEEVLNLADPLP